MDVSSLCGRLPDVEEPHQVNILSVDVTENLSWGSDFFDDDWLSSKNACAFACKLDDVLRLAWEWELSTWLDVLSFLWLQERLQEHLA